MLQSFNEMPENSRVWIYQANREFVDAEVVQINDLIEDFIQNWNNHGDGLKASYQIKYNQFIILAVDENFKMASGCSIDSSVQLMKKIEKEFNVNLFDRMQTAFKDGKNVNLVSMVDFQKYVKASKITPKTIVFNNMVNTKIDFDNNWETPANESWHARFF